MRRVVSSRINRLAAKIGDDVQGREFYFFDYEHAPINKKEFGRDYFGIPTQLLLAIAGYQPSASGRLRVYAQRVVSSLVENLDDNDGLFLPNPNERVSTVDQAWAAILLKTAARKEQTPPRTASICYWLTRRRPDKWYTDMVPGVAIIATTVGNVVAEGQDLVLRTALAVGLLLLSAIFGERYIRKLVPGVDNDRS